MQSENWKGYVYEHIVVAEEVLGRPCRDTEVVHRLNGRRDDNRSKNLLVLERTMHSILHAWMSAGAVYEGVGLLCPLRLDEPKHKEPRDCLVCGKTIQSTNNDKHCSNECRGFSSRKAVHPSVEVLKEEMSKYTWEDLGRKYGVSSNAVRKWAKKYELI